MMPAAVLDRLARAATIVSQICDISGVPSASVGVLHHDEIIWRDNFGYRDVATQKKSTSDTMYGIGSLTKGFVAASLGQLLDNETSASWLSPIRETIPSFKPKDPQLDGTVAVADFLSHRTGLLGDMSVASQGGLEFLLPPEDLIPTVANLKSVALFRQQWLYNNWGYSMAGAVIEELSKKPFYDYMKEAILDPLKLSNTTTRPILEDDTDFAEAYIALQDTTFHHLPKSFPFKKSVFESAGGMFSTVNDLLRYAQAILEAERDPVSSPIKNVQILRSNQVPLDNPSRDCRFYGMGWVGTQLPGVVGLQGDNADLFDWDELPTLGRGSHPMMTYYHQGAGIGYYSALFTFPETQSAVVVLTNSIPLNDAADWIAQVLVSALFGFTDNVDYIHFAQESRRRKLANVAAVYSRFEDIRRHYPGGLRPLKVYIGRYCNDLQNFFIDVRKHPENPDCLELAFQGKGTQVYELRHLQNDVFEWALSYDESARRARFTIWDPFYFEIDFEINEKNQGLSLKWAKITDILPEGMKMTRCDDNTPPMSGKGIEDSEPQRVLGRS